MSALRNLSRYTHRGYLKGSVTYIVQLDGQPTVKIGRTANMRERMTGLANSIPHQFWLGSAKPELKLIALLDDGNHEQLLHVMFKTSNIRGEWFRLTPEIRRFARGHRPKPRQRVKRCHQCNGCGTLPLIPRWLKVVTS